MAKYSCQWCHKTVERDSEADVLASWCTTIEADVFLVRVDGDQD